MINTGVGYVDKSVFYVLVEIVFIVYRGVLKMERQKRLILFLGSENDDDRNSDRCHLGDPEGSLFAGTDFFNGRHPEGGGGGGRPCWRRNRG